MSATDPVAVLATLREVGASPRLATLIEAEALINDGSAFVLFIICKNVVLGSSATVGAVRSLRRGLLALRFDDSLLIAVC